MRRGRRSIRRYSRRGRNATLETSLCEGSSIRVGAQSRAAISLVNDAVLRLDENTTMRLVNIIEEEEEQSLLDILRGAIQSFSRKPKKLMVNSPYLNGSIEGTEFVFRVTDEQTEITVFEGTVVASNSQGESSVTAGESVVAQQGQAPTKRILVNPRNEVTWGLNYPSILISGERSADPQVIEIAMLLESGRVNQAREKLAPLMASDNGLAYALSSVINIALNETAQALEDGARAVDLAPSAPSFIALSYAQQSNLDLESARATLQQANEANPDNALVLARLAELNLMMGSRSEAVDLAQRAVSINSELDNPQVVLGFAALALNDHATAGTAFETAISLNSSNPLSHLGLGLSKISAGDLVAGRKDIEAAVALDSNDAILRSYLGKSYFEEKRSNLAEDQYDIAKSLDPNDPTAFLYSGIQKQTDNRPVEALNDIEQSIELNDNRAVYRSRFLLDQDRAARGTSIARAYSDLGFNKLATNEASESLMLDPSNASAHRFLSDSYKAGGRTEIGRVSELFQAQMLQDVNLTPIQPSLA
ncbi:MAG: tetratricopeptide repeat protein, partial [Gammaproteobacteria bacterium]|nr:tetratricopeptide repeat protein [Gammaproteobacteria bacterium]